MVRSSEHDGNEARAASPDWRELMQLAADPYSMSGDRWIGALPAHVNWAYLDDRLIARGWYPKNAIARLRVYGCEGGHEIVLEPSSREVVIRIHSEIETEQARATCAERLARTLVEEALRAPVLEAPRRLTPAP
jgi:hypothetical protein